MSVAGSYFERKCLESQNDCALTIFRGLKDFINGADIREMRDLIEDVAQGQDDYIEQVAKQKWGEDSIEFKRQKNLQKALKIAILSMSMQEVMLRDLKDGILPEGANQYRLPGLKLQEGK